MSKSITDFITNNVQYVEGAQLIAICNPPLVINPAKFLVELRVWKEVTKLFTDDDNNVDINASSKYTDYIGQWIADAINEKLSREKRNRNETVPSGTNARKHSSIAQR